MELTVKRKQHFEVVLYTGAMYSVVIECRADEVEAVLAEAAGEAGVELAGVEEPAAEHGRLRLWLADGDDATRLAARLRAWKPRVETADDGENWNEAWQRREWRAAEVGRRFFLVPPWEEDRDTRPTPGGRIRLTMHAGTAFGNGDHPATHLCLMAMEEDLKPGDVFLDVGCGSGLLGEAAMALGARAAWGCDVARGLGSFTGSVDAVRTASCDYVAANIQLGVLVELVGDVRRVLRPGGRGVLSGILPEQRAELEEAARAAGLVCLHEGAAELGGWAAVRIAAGPMATPSCA